MDQFCTGQAQAFDLLYARHAVALRGFFLRMVRSDSAADDLLQVTFLHLCKSRGRFRKGERFAPWLYAIARNAGRDYLRLASHRYEEAAPPDLQVAAPVDEGAGTDPAEVRALQEALANLPPQYREAVLLHQVEGLSFEEVAQVLGSTRGAVKVRAHRGYERLRTALAAWKRGRKP